MLKQTVVPVIGLLLSWVVTKKISIDLWGEVTQITLGVSLITHLASWGNTEYLLKEFSIQPGKIKALWQTCFIDRLPILLLVCCGIFIYFRNTLGCVIALWCIIEYTYQSYTPLINFHKKFMVGVFAEIGGALLLFPLLFMWRQHMDLLLVVTLLMGADLLKTIITILYFKNYLGSIKIQKPNVNYFREAFSFFLLGFIGLLCARTDLLYVTIYMNHRDIAFYQIATTFFLFIKGGASMLILPFVPVLYRVKKDMIFKLSLKFTVLGTALSILAFIAIYFILIKGYKFEVGFPFMLVGFLSIIPAFYNYSIVIFLFKQHKQKRVVLYGIVEVVLILLFNALLVPFLGTLGAIIALTLAEWMVIPIYLYNMRLPELTKGGNSYLI